MTTSTRRALALVLCLAHASPAVVLAQPPPPRASASGQASKEAKAELDAARKLVALGEHSAALPHLEKALSLSGDAALWLEIAQAERGAGRPARAFRAAERFLEEARPEPASKARKEAEALLAALAPQVGRITVKVSPEGAAVAVDDEATRAGAPVVVATGKHRVRASKAGFLAREAEVVVSAGAALSVDLSLEAEIAPLSASLSGQALTDYESGKLLYNDGDYATALLKFRSAHAASGDARLLWNMAACEKNLRHYGKVLGLLERYLKEGAKVVSAQDRAEAEELSRVVRAFVTPVRISASEPDAEVTVDDQPAGKTPLEGPLLLDVGSRKIKVEKEGFSPFQAQITVSGAEEMVVPVSLKAVRHEGRLVVSAGPRDAISVDGKPAGTGHWEGTVSSGAHSVQITADGRRPYQSDVAVLDGETRRVQVQLEPLSSSGSSAWLWVGGGAVLLTGLGVGGYFLLRPQEKTAPPAQPGTMPPGTVQLPLRPFSFR